MLPSRPPVRTVAPAATPVSLAEVKAHLRVDHADEDVYLGALIDAATALLDGADGALGRALVTQTWRHDFDGWNGAELRLAMPGASSVSIAYTDTAGASQTLAGTEYEVVEDSRGTVIVPASGKVWPALADVASPVRVTATHGFGNAAAVPAAIKQAMLLMIGDWYETRQTAIYGANIKEVPMYGTVGVLLAPYRRGWMAA